MIVLTGGGPSGLGAGLRHAAKGQALGILIVGGIDIIQGVAEDKSAGEILVDVMGDATKALIATAITTGISAVAVTTIPLTVPAGVTVMAGIGVGILVGHGLDLLNEEIGASNWLSAEARRAQSWLEEQYHEYVRVPFMRLRSELEQTIPQQYGASSPS